MKRLTFTTLIVILVLGLCTFGTWFYLKPTDSSTFSGFIKTLKHNGCIVKDVTKDYAKNYPENQKYPDNQKVLSVDGKYVYISMETTATVQRVFGNYLSLYSDPLANFVGIPHLYQKGNLLVRYFGEDKKLLNTLENVLGKSYIN